MSSLVVQHNQVFGSNPDFSYSVSGRVQIFGTFGGYFGGAVLGAALDQKVEVLMSRGREGMLRFFAPELKEKKKSSLSPIKYRREDRWANFMKGAFSWAMDKSLPFHSCAMTIGGDLPRDMGLGSSQALSLATLGAGRHFFGWDVEDKALLLGAHWIEKDFVGRDVPITDFQILEHSKGGAYIFGEPHRGFWEQIPVDPEVGFYLLVTDLPRSSFEESLEDKVQECKSGLEKWGWTGFYDGLFLDQDRVRSQEHLLSHTLRRRCHFLLEENQRAKEGAAALKEKDYPLVGKLMNRSHDGLSDLFEVSCPEIDWLVKRCQELPQVYGAKIIGEGIGKSIVALGDQSFPRAFESALVEYERIFGFPVRLIPVKPSRALDS